MMLQMRLICCIITWPCGRITIVGPRGRHFPLVVVKMGPGRRAVLNRSEEGVSQCDLFDMALYGAALMPLVEQVKRDVPQHTTPFYADDTAAAGQVEKKNHVAMPRSHRDGGT